MIHHPGATMQTLKSSLLLSAALCLAACAGIWPAPSFSDEFATEISANGTKFFTYVRHFPKGTAEHYRDSSGTKSDKTLHAAVQAKLDATAYCRDGYLTLERYLANGIARIRGECRDGASDSDREKFPNLP
jgi:hypothetical protein